MNYLFIKSIIILNIIFGLVLFDISIQIKKPINQNKTIIDSLNSGNKLSVENNRHAKDFYFQEKINKKIDTMLFRILGNYDSIENTYYPTYLYIYLKDNPIPFQKFDLSHFLPWYNFSSPEGKIKFVDMNFDGYKDFEIFFVEEDRGILYYSYMFDKLNNYFVLNNCLSRYFNKEFDDVNKLVCIVNNRWSNDITITYYKIVDDTLKLINQKECKYEENTSDWHCYYSKILYRKNIFHKKGRYDLKHKFQIIKNGDKKINEKIINWP